MLARKARAQAMFRPMQSPPMVQKDRQKADSGPDFRHVTEWIFDLDNTLYRADNGIFAQIEARMTDYVMAFLKLPREEAYARQKDLTAAHGTTLSGLMREHGAAPDDYLHYVHDIDLSSLGPDAALAAAIENLPGRRFVFTNGCRDHAARILNRLGMTHLFDDVWDIRTMDFMPKPETRAYDSVVAAGGVARQSRHVRRHCPQSGAGAQAGHDHGMVEDRRTLGKTRARDGRFRRGDIDHETDNLTQFLHSIRI